MDKEHGYVLHRNPIQIKPENYLMHYASEYYDPVKAHEYYEEHKKLKGRKSTASLNEKGQAAAMYAKDQINQKRDKDIEAEGVRKQSKIDQASDKKEADTEAAKSEKDKIVSQYTEHTQRSIDQLRNELKNMSASQKKAKSEEINRRIQSLREENASRKAEFMAKYGAQKESITAEYYASKKEATETHKANVKSIKAKADEQYLTELDSIKADPTMTKTGKKSSTSGGTTSRSKSDYDPFANAFKYKEAAAKKKNK